VENGARLDRLPWLRDLVEVFANHARADSTRTVVVACSALKRIYRNILREGARERGLAMLFVLLEVGKEEAQRRAKQRNGHFMSESLIEDQLATLEAADSEDDVRIVSAERPLEEVLSDCVDHIEELRRVF